MTYRTTARVSCLAASSRCSGRGSGACTRAVAGGPGPGRQSLPLTQFVPVILAFAGSAVYADTDIHRCLLEDGTFAFQGTPCAEPAESGNDEPGAGDDAGIESTADTVEGQVRPPALKETATPPPPADPPAPESISADRSECEKTTRDAIDAIDLEIRNHASDDSRRDYLAELLALTEQLRACKRL